MVVLVNIQYFNSLNMSVIKIFFPKKDTLLSILKVQLEASQLFLCSLSMVLQRVQQK